METTEELEELVLELDTARILFAEEEEEEEEARIVISIKDITTRKQAEEVLRLFKDSVEHSSDAVGMSTPEGKHYYQNEAFERLFGDIGDCPPAAIYVDQTTGKRVFDTIMAGEKWQGEVQMFKKDRTILDILLRAYPHPGQGRPHHRTRRPAYRHHRAQTNGGRPAGERGKAPPPDRKQPRHHLYAHRGWGVHFRLPCLDRASGAPDNRGCRTVLPEIRPSG